MELATGQSVERYDVEALVGEGGMAEVYRVRHRTLGSRHALKVLKLEITGLKERLVQEGQVQATLRHPNIVAVTDIVEVAGKPGLVMEYIEGPTLERWLAEHHPTLEEAEALFLGILSGVARAHRVGLVHRDLKPGNVLLEETDEGVIPKVTDFGLAKLLVEEGGTTRTRSGVPMGTPAYMAPEQVRDAANVDQRADIFALGAILYELLCGVPPFDGPDALSIFGRLAKGDYIPPEALVPTLPERFRRAVAGALHGNRDDRIPDCASLRALFRAGQESTDTTSARVVPLRGAGPRRTIAHTLEPAGHAKVSASDTFVADGLAEAGPSTTLAPGVEAAAAPVRRSVLPWGIGAAVAGLFVAVGLGAAGLGAWYWVGRDTPKPAHRPRPAVVETPDTTIPEVPSAPPPAAPVEASAAPTPPSPVAAPGPAAPSAPNGAPALAPAPVTAQVPVPAPVPVPLTASAPVVAPAAPPAPTLTGRVTFTGDADEVWLQSGDKRLAATELLPGDYAIIARFGDETVPSGTVHVRAGAPTEVHCARAFRLCKAR